MDRTVRKMGRGKREKEELTGRVDVFRRLTIRNETRLRDLRKANAKTFGQPETDQSHK